MVQTEINPLGANLDHLLAELGLLDMRLSREARRMRGQGDNGRLDQGFEGLIISEPEVDRLLDQQGFGGLDVDPDPMLGEIQQKQKNLADRRSSATWQGVVLPLERLRQAYDLDEWELDLIILCLAPELDRKYEGLFSYLQDDIGKKQPTVDLALKLLCADPLQRVERRKYFDHSAALVKHELIQLFEDRYSKDSPLLARFIRLDPWLVEFLLGSESVDRRLQPFTSLEGRNLNWDRLIMPVATRETLGSLVANIQDQSFSSRGTLVQLIGPEGSGKTSVAEGLAQSLDKPLLTVDCPGLLKSSAPLAQLVNLACREAKLRGAALAWDNWIAPNPEDPKSRELSVELIRALQQQAGLTIVMGETRWQPERLGNQHFFTVELPAPDYSERRRIWESGLENYHHRLDSADVASLSGKFRFNGGQIRQALATARDRVVLRSGADASISLDDLTDAARWHSSQGLAALAQKVESRYLWEDLALPKDQLALLREICGYFEGMPKVYEEWGFQRKTSLGKGLNILFAGVSGTGKTMSAQIIASELGLDLYKIDLATVVSKYIGETEKNLDRIFREAESSNAILFFDEADALFGKRSEVRDAHDRYANIEVSYLLQRMDEYQGIVILASNFRKNIDDAFARRLHFAVEFPFPEEQQRLEIWRRVFPPEAPLEDGVDLSLLARQFKLSGGNIKNIAVIAAFLAAQDNVSIGIENVMWAAKREYQKMGKLLVETDFGPYFDLVKQ